MSDPETSLNTVFKCVATVCKATMMATAISEASSAYSIAVAPRSSLIKAIKVVQEDLEIVDLIMKEVEEMEEMEDIEEIVEVEVMVKDLMLMIP